MVTSFGSDYWSRRVGNRWPYITHEIGSWDPGSGSPRTATVRSAVGLSIGVERWCRAVNQPAPTTPASPAFHPFRSAGGAEVRASGVVAPSLRTRRHRTLTGGDQQRRQLAGVRQLYALRGVAQRAAFLAQFVAVLAGLADDRTVVVSEQGVAV